MVNNSSQSDLEVSRIIFGLLPGVKSKSSFFQPYYNGSSSTLDIQDEKVEKVKSAKTLRVVGGDIFFLAFLVLIYSYFVWATVHFVQNSGKHKIRLACRFPGTDFFLNEIHTFTSFLPFH